MTTWLRMPAESFYVNVELPDDHPYVRAGIRSYGGNRWPASLPGFREDMLAYRAAITALGAELMALIALSLELPEDYFAPMFALASGTLRLIHYPPQPADAAVNQIGAGAHTDWGGITLLLQDDTGGLEVRNRDGDWLIAPPVKDAFVVNIGDLLQRWTNDLYRSNMHRVLNGAGARRDRYSVPFFYSPDYASKIECLPTCTSTGLPPLHPPCTAGEHMMEMFNLTYGRRTAPGPAERRV